MGTVQSTPKSSNATSTTIDSLCEQAASLQMTDRKQALLRVQHLRRLHQVWQKKHRNASLQDAADPRSPTLGLRRTPLKHTADTPVSRTAILAAMQSLDPRSPSLSLNRTPIAKILGLEGNATEEAIGEFTDVNDTETVQQPSIAECAEPVTPRSALPSAVDFSMFSTPKTPRTPEPTVSEPATPSSMPAVSDRARRQFTSSILAEMSPMQLSPSKLRKLQPKEVKRVNSLYSLGSVGSAKSQRSYCDDKENDATASPVQRPTMRSFGTPVATK